MLKSFGSAGKVPLGLKKEGSSLSPAAAGATSNCTQSIDQEFVKSKLELSCFYLGAAGTML